MFKIKIGYYLELLMPETMSGLKKNQKKLVICGLVSNKIADRITKV